jgi:hypothetical protein
MLPEQTSDGHRQLPEELVAYLDGEMDASESRRLEERLANEPDLRRALEELERTWNLLDELEPPPLDEDFTRTTLEMVAVAADEDASCRRAEAPRRRRRRWIAAAVGLLAAAAAGLGGVALLAPDPNAQLRRDLPILESLNQYRQVDGVDFLRLLVRDKVFADDADETPAAWPGDIGAMTADQKEELSRHRQQFAALGTAEQQRIRQLHEQLLQEPDGAKLREVMNRYCQWLSAQPAYRGAQLLELKPPARIKQIQQEQGRVAGKRLEVKDLEAIARWTEQYATEHEAQLLEILSKSARARLAKLSPAMRHRVVLATLCQRWQSGNPDSHPAITDAETADLLSRLSPELRGRLESKPAAEQSRLWAACIRQAARWQITARRAEGLSLFSGLDDQLADYFEFQLTAEERDHLMSLPADEMQQRLRELYLTEAKSAEPLGHRSDRSGHAKRPPAPAGKSKKDAHPAPKSPPEKIPPEEAPDEKPRSTR